MIVVSTTQKEVVIKRAFKSLVANDVRQKLEVGYIEVTELDGEVIKQEEKVYNRDYAFWKNSNIGVN
jgi:adenylylsulfate kinase-like enzyme